MTDALKLYGARPMSMGCLVDTPACSICGQVITTCEHTKPATCDCDPDGHYDCHGQGSCGAYDTPTFPMQVMVSLVPAPKCDECGESMVPANDTEWMCEFKGCEAEGEPRGTGIYPVRSAPGA